jgi:hypothetical protein
MVQGWYFLQCEATKFTAIQLIPLQDHRQSLPAHLSPKQSTLDFLFSRAEEHLDSSLCTSPIIPFAHTSEISRERIFFSYSNATLNQLYQPLLPYCTALCLTPFISQVHLATRRACLIKLVHQITLYHSSTGTSGLCPLDQSQKSSKIHRKTLNQN